jgi:hypothetical protein
MTHRYATSTHHSDSYYKILLLALSRSVHAGLPYREIASYLKDLGLTTPTGRQFTSKTVENTLSSLRRPSELPSIAYRAMMKFIFDGELTKEQYLPLLSSAEVQL